MSNHNKKPKYKLDPKKFVAQEEVKKKNKEDTWSESGLYEEMLRSKSRHRH